MVFNVPRVVVVVKTFRWMQGLLLSGLKIGHALIVEINTSTENLEEQIYRGLYLRGSVMFQFQGCWS